MAAFDSQLQHAEAFLQRALVLGCTDEEALLWADIAVAREWKYDTHHIEFEDAVVDYLVRLGAAETWPQELRQVLARERDLP